MEAKRRPHQQPVVFRVAKNVGQFDGRYHFRSRTPLQSEDAVTEFGLQVYRRLLTRRTDYKTFM